MPIDPSAVGAESGPVEYSWTSKDALLYAVGVGAGATELAFTTENSAGIDQQVLPTFAVIPGMSVSAIGAAGTFDFTQLVHGEQAFELHRPLPVEATVSSTSRLVGVYDKGKGAVLASETTSLDAATGEVLFTNRSSVFIRGAGGFGGDRGPSASGSAVPERLADRSVTYPTSPDQALIYRLSGDRNPLHADPTFAALAGFERPILHGLCTYGVTGRVLLQALCDGDASRFASMEGRFSAPVYPGEDLTVDMWLDGDGSAVFTTTSSSGVRVIDAGRVTFRTA